MFTLIGILIIIFAVGMLIAVNVLPLRKEAQQVDNGYNGTKTIPAHPAFLTSWSTRRSVFVSLLGFAVIAINGMFFYNPAGTAKIGRASCRERV